MEKLFFDNTLAGAFVEAFGSAKRKIQISTFKLEIYGKNIPRPVAAIAAALEAALLRGVEVEILLNWRPGRSGVPRTNDYCAIEMINRRAKVRYLPSGRCIHAKIIIIDDVYAILGSHNFSVRSFVSNFEASTEILEPVLVTALSTEFARLFCAAKSF